jgi:peptidoglycan hydrolase-like protein with peptidoglycan-binding domain
VGSAVLAEEGTSPARRAFLALLARALLRWPAETVGLVVVAFACVAIVVNALYLQPSPHPAPMLAAKARPKASPDSIGTVSTDALPAPAPAAGAQKPAARTRTQVITEIQRELARRRFYDGPIDGVHGPRTDAAIRDFQQAAGRTGPADPDEALLRAITSSTVIAPTPPLPPAAPRPPAEIPRRSSQGEPVVPSKRIMAIQRALADFGYGQLVPTGVLGAETRAAIERFERERKLPITGQISDHLVRELAAMTGRPLE